MPRFNRLLSPRAVFAVLAAAAVLAMAARLGTVDQSLLVSRLEQETSRVPAEDVGTHLSQFTKLGAVGIEGLVRALGNERDDVSEQAYRLLEQALQTWRGLPHRDSSERVFHLAASLNEHRESFGPMASRNAARLTQLILLWPIDRTVVDGTALIQHCEAVVQAAAPIPPRSPISLATVAESRLLPAPTVPALPRYRAADLPANSGQLVIRDSDDPREIVPPPPSTIAGLPILAAEPRAKPIEEPASELKPAPRRPLRPRPLLLPSPREEVPVATLAPTLDHLEDIAVMRLLHSRLPIEAEAAKQELAARGFQPLQLELARQLVAPEVEQRLDLIQRLPSVPGIDPLPWLFWLAQDAEDEVHAAAKRVLSTSSDPAVHERLQRLKRRSGEGDRAAQDAVTRR